MTAFTGEWHPFAARFPMLPDDELKELADDISANGQLHPVLITPEGIGIDGRNRFRACEIAGVEPRFEVFEGNPAALIVSANAQRRHMTPGQRAMSVAIGLAEQGKRSNSRWQRDSICQTSDISRDSLHRCGVVLDWDARWGTTYADDVLTGAIPLSEVYKTVMRARRMESDAENAAETARREADERRERERQQYDELRANATDLAELVRLEKLTLDDARAAWENRQREEQAARQSAINAWGRASDGLLAALSWAASGFTPPDPMPSGYTSAAEFRERLESLNRIVKQWETP